MRYFKNILPFFFAAVSVAFAQNVSLNDTVHIVYGALTYNGQTIFVTDKGLEINGSYAGANSRQGSTNEQFSRYYKKIYGKDAENPNFVIDGENMGFIPFVNINELYGNNAPLINGVSVSDFAKAFSDKNFAHRQQVIDNVKNYAESLTKARGNSEK